MKKILLAVLTLVIISGYTPLCHALDPDTHKAINEHVAKGTINGFSLGGYLKNQLGMDDGVGEFFGMPGDRQRVWQWVRVGGLYEDAPHGTCPMSALIIIT